MKKIKFIAMLFIATLVFVSCQNEDALENEEVLTENYPVIASKLQKMYFNTNDLEVINRNLPDGTKQRVFIVEGDITFTEEQIINMKMGGNIGSKQYRTNNLVSTPWWWGSRTITILGYSEGGIFDLNSKERSGLSHAVYNYNSLNLDIKFNLSFGSDTSKDMVVYHDPYNSGNGGISGFPYNGNPNKWISVYGLAGYSNDVHEHVITHEMGHSVGFRHTDWNTRRSCGGSGEAAGSDGAVHIPGTPTGFDASSLMIACFTGSENGEFNANDKIALNYLY